MRGILFLDFDGVLNRITPTGYDPRHPGLRQENIEEVARVAEIFDLGVVVSSSWRSFCGSCRRVHDLEELWGFVQSSGRGAGHQLARRMIGVTPVHERDINGLRVAGTRAAEVSEWLVSTTLKQGIPYVILDDSKKHGFEPKRFVRTNGATGFVREDAARVAEILERQGLTA